MPKRKKKKTYEAEFCLQCMLANQVSVGGMARTLDAIGVILCEYHEAGIRLKDREMLAEGVFSFVTQDPEAAEAGASLHRPLAAVGAACPQKPTPAGRRPCFPGYPARWGG